MPLPKDHVFFGMGHKLTDEQTVYVNSIIDNQVTIVNAPSGSGKTTLAVACAKYLQRDLVYIFSPVEENSLGFTPGTVEEKESKYFVPLKDALIEINEQPEKVIESSSNINNIKQGNTWVKAMSHVFARGTNIKSDEQSKKLVIIDESQNFTRGELKKVLTRIHDNVKVVIIGHDGQCDLDNPRKSGFIPYIEHLQDEPYVRVCKLTRNFRGNLARKSDELNW